MKQVFIRPSEIKVTKMQDGGLNISIPTLRDQSQKQVQSGDLFEDVLFILETGSTFDSGYALLPFLTVNFK